MRRRVTSLSSRITCKRPELFHNLPSVWITVRKPTDDERANLAVGEVFGELLQLEIRGLPAGRHVRDSSLLTSLVATRVMRYLAHHSGILDKPGSHKQHSAPTPAVGGVGVYLAFVVGTALSGPLSPKLIAILLASGLLVLVGFVDDIRGVHANIKLAVLGVCTWILWIRGIHLNAFGFSGLLALFLSFLWTGLVSSSFNGVDNADGSASGLACISSLCAFAISWQTWQHELAVVSLVLAGSCLGFLAYNFPAPRATIFLGDCGSLFLGFGLATLTALGEWSPVSWKAATVALLLVAVPLFDFLFILIVRGLEGRYREWDDPIKMCARDHVFHRLSLIGLSHRQCLAVLYTGAVLCGLSAYRSVTDPTILSVETLIFAVLALATGGFLLGRVKPPEDAYPGNA